MGFYEKHSKDFKKPKIFTRLLCSLAYIFSGILGTEDETGTGLKPMTSGSQCGTYYQNRQSGSGLINFLSFLTTVNFLMTLRVRCLYFWIRCSVVYPKSGQNSSPVKGAFYLWINQLLTIYQSVYITYLKYCKLQNWAFVLKKTTYTIRGVKGGFRPPINVLPHSPPWNFCSRPCLIANMNKLICYCEKIVPKNISNIIFLFW